MNLNPSPSSLILAAGILLAATMDLGARQVVAPPIPSSTRAMTSSVVLVPRFTPGGAPKCKARPTKTIHAQASLRPVQQSAAGRGSGGNRFLVLARPSPKGPPKIASGR